MQLKRFQAPTMGEAYQRVRATLGDDAVIVSTRSASTPGLLGAGRREFVEVVAGTPEAAAAVSGNAPARETAGPAESDAENDTLNATLNATLNDTENDELAPPFVNTLAGSRRAGPFDIFTRDESQAPAVVETETSTWSESDDYPAPIPAQAGQETVTPELGRQVDGIASQLAQVRSMLEQMSVQTLDRRIDSGPTILQEARSRLIDQGVGPYVLIPVLDEVADAIVGEATSQMVLQTMERKLAAKLPPVVTLDIGRTSLAIFVIGPGGAGKTTTAARLGMELESERGARVTLASIDVNRTGAPQQLMAYGAATGLRARVCYAPGELQSLLAEGSSDVVIVDSPGNTGARSDRMAELNAFMQVARDRAVLLTLPATTKGEDARRITSTLAEIGVDGLVLTRCDETETYGSLLTVACESGIGIAYSSHGEGLSEALRVGDNHALSLAVVVGDWPDRNHVSQATALTG